MRRSPLAFVMILPILTTITFTVGAASEPPPAGSSIEAVTEYACQGAAGPPDSPAIRRLEEASHPQEKNRLIACLSENETPVIEPATPPNHHRMTFPYLAPAGVESVRLDSLLSAVLIDEPGDDLRGYDHSYEELVGVHDEITWQTALARGLVALLPG